jgi:hypothetical protein
MAPGDKSFRSPSGSWIALPLFPPGSGGVKSYNIRDDQSQWLTFHGTHTPPWNLYAKKADNTWQHLVELLPRDDLVYAAVSDGLFGLCGGQIGREVMTETIGDDTTIFSFVLQPYLVASGYGLEALQSRSKTLMYHFDGDDWLLDHTQDNRVYEMSCLDVAACTEQFHLLGETLGVPAEDMVVAGIKLKIRAGASARQIWDHVDISGIPWPPTYSGLFGMFGYTVGVGTTKACTAMPDPTSIGQPNPYSVRAPVDTSTFYYDLLWNGAGFTESPVLVTPNMFSASDSVSIFHVIRGNLDTVTVGADIISDGNPFMYFPPDLEEISQTYYSFEEQVGITIENCLIYYALPGVTIPEEVWAVDPF